MLSRQLFETFRVIFKHRHDFFCLALGIQNDMADFYAVKLRRIQTIVFFNSLVIAYLFAHFFQQQHICHKLLEVLQRKPRCVKIPVHLHCAV